MHYLATPGSVYSLILDPDGRPLKGRRVPYVVDAGYLTNRDKVQVPQHPQLIAGSLSNGCRRQPLEVMRRQRR